MAHSFFLRLWVFLAPLLVCGGLLEWKVSAVPTSYSRKAELLASRRAELQVLILGSSHALFGLDPRYLSRPALSLANASQSIWTDAELLEHHAPGLPRLQAVIVAFSPFTLGFKTADGQEAWRNWFYFRSLGVLGDQEGLDRYSPRSLLSTLAFGPDQVRQMIRDGFTDTLEGNLTSGGAELQGSAAAADLTAPVAAAVVKRHRGTWHEDRVPDALLQAQRIVRLARQRQAQVLFVSTPLHPLYREQMDATGWARSQQAVRSLCGGGVRYLDFTADPDFADPDFHDVDHVNASGARKLTRKVDAQL